MKYLEQYRRLHAKKKFMSFSAMQFAPEITELIVEFRSKSILDYGCGSGDQYTIEKLHRVFGVKMPAMYDPAVMGRDKLPDGVFDGVLSTDVLEHIPEDELDQVLLGAERTQDILAERLLLYVVDELADDVDIDVSFEQGEPDLTQSVLDIALGDSALAGEFLKNPFQATAQVLKHG